MQITPGLFRRCVLALAAVSVSAVGAAFEPAAFTPNVVDQAGVLTSEQIAELNAGIQFLRDKADVWSAVYVVPTLGGEPIESAAEETFRRWELGAKGRDNGLLLIFAIDDREARIEVGYGLEGDITDAHARRVLDDVILPHFKSEDYAAGIRAGLGALGYIKTRDPVFLESSPQLRSRGGELLRGGDSDPDSGSMFGPGEFERGFGWWLWWAALVLGLPFVLRLLKILRTGVPAGRSALGYLVGWDLSAAIRAFLLVNPGVFILLAPLMLGDMEPEISGLLSSAETELALARGRVWLGLLFVAPLLIRVPCYLVGRSRPGNPNPVYQKSSGVLLLYLADVDSAWAVIRKLVMALIPGVFFSVVAMIFESAAAGYWAGMLLAGAFGIGFVRHEWLEEGAPLLSERHWRRHAARARLRRIQTRVEGTRQVFGRSYTYHRPSSSSSSSSRSGGFSSSSGGGRSGGGGASSRW